jgi:quinol monooxygenase YgiN
VINIRTRPDTYEELHRRLLELVEPTRAEPGCLQHELHTCDEDPLQLTFVETWASDTAHAAHDETAHVRAIQAEILRLISHPLTVHRLRKSQRGPSTVR